MQCILDSKKSTKIKCIYSDSIYLFIYKYKTLYLGYQTNSFSPSIYLFITAMFTYITWKTYRGENSLRVHRFGNRFVSNYYNNV